MSQSAPPPYWTLMGIASLVLFFTFLVPLFRSIHLRRFRLLPLVLPPLMVSYFLLQCVFMGVSQSAVSPAARAAVAWFSKLSPGVLAAGMAALFAAVCLLFHALNRYESSQITSSSIKEAVDHFPAGICVYLEGGQVVMVNSAMEQFCLRATGQPLVSGEELLQCLRHGALQPGCERILAGETLLIVFSEGSAWSVAKQDLPYAHTTAHRLLMTEVTETYQKTKSLQVMQEKLAATNAHLIAYNQEIVALTAEKELLDARVRLHDQMGEDLLTMKRLIRKGGSPAEQAAIEEMLRRNVSFIKTGQQGAKRDEYTLMLETAEKLGVHVTIAGMLPQAEPQKHIIATAIHECFTNTLRHAHGDALHVRVTRERGQISVSFTNNGRQPDGPIRETGGLSSLRALTERAGGSMTVTACPSFSIVLTLPEEVAHGLQSIDRR